MANPDSPPIIDAQQFLSLERADEIPPRDVCDAIAAACRTHGFFQLINAGVDVTVTAALRKAMLWFFDQPVEEKRLIKRSEENAMGFADDELTKQSRDMKEIFDWCYVPFPDLPDNHPDNKTVDGTNRWPAGHPEFKAALDCYFKEMTRCAFKLTEAFCIALGLEAKALHHLFEDGVGFARLNFYEVQPKKKGETDASPPLGIHHHTDAGFLTILLQDKVAGLEVLRNGAWHGVQPIPGALTINVGDMCQVLSNDQFKAPVHRVVAPTEKRRYSAAFFFNPAPGADIAPLPRFISNTQPPYYRPINWGQFRSGRFAGDYADVGEEVQISHFRL